MNYTKSKIEIQKSKMGCASAVKTARRKTQRTRLCRDSQPDQI
jgi:hypothetical protein